MEHTAYNIRIEHRYWTIGLGPTYGYRLEYRSIKSGSARDLRASDQCSLVIEQSVLCIFIDKHTVLEIRASMSAQPSHGAEELFTCLALAPSSQFHSAFPAVDVALAGGICVLWGAGAEQADALVLEADLVWV